MPQSGTTSIRTRLNTYTAYGIGCAAVWAVILIVTQRQTDSQTRNTIRLMCAGWWLGWMSASIARVVYPPPKKLKPEVYNRVVMASIVLLAVGIMRPIRLLMAGEQPAVTAADASAPLGGRCGSAGGESGA
jgi:phosphatidylserine synthase